MDDIHNPNIPHYCEGGCGQLTKFDNGKWQKFIPGHFIRGAHTFEEYLKIYNNKKPIVDILCNPSISHYCECIKKCGKLTNFYAGKWCQFIQGHNDNISAFKKYYKTHEVWNVGKTKDDDNRLKRNSPSWNKGKTAKTDSRVASNAKALKGIKRTKIRSDKGIKRLKKQKAMSAKGRQNIREGVLRHVENLLRQHGYSVTSFIGKYEKQTLDNQEELDNCKINRGFHIIGHGFKVDGYCKETNTVYEVDEPYHYNITGVLRDKDIKRQNEVQDALYCKVIRIKIDKDGKRL